MEAADSIDQILTPKVTIVTTTGAPEVKPTKQQAAMKRRLQAVTMQQRVAVTLELR